jgi:hypothetical protein
VTIVNAWVDPYKQMKCPLQPQMVLEPFDKWAIDFVGPINPPSRRHSYILVCTDYVTKWMEEKALSTTTEQQ